MKDAVELYEFAMAGANKPTVQCCVFLLRKVAAGKELDMDLFLRVLKVFTGSGNLLTDSMADAVLKTLTSVGRTGEWNKVLKEMEDCGNATSLCCLRRGQGDLEAYDKWFVFNKISLYLVSRQWESCP